VAVVSFDSVRHLPGCLESIPDALAGLAADVVVVDNASRDGSAGLVRERFPEVTVIECPTNRGYGAAANLALARCRAPYLLIANADVVFLPGCIARLVAHLDSSPRDALAGPLLLREDGHPVPPARSFPTLLLEACELFLVHRIWPGNPVHARHARADLGTGSEPEGPAGGLRPPSGRPGAVDWLVGAVLLARREAMTEVGGFDEAYGLYYEETDLAWRLAQRGWGVAYRPEAHATHAGGGSSSGGAAPQAAEAPDAPARPAGAFGPLLEQVELASQYRFFRRRSGAAAVAALWLVQIAGCLFRLLFWGARRALRPHRERHLAPALARTLRHLAWLARPVRPALPRSEAYSL
jgi:GT2 family glycosyltransferase